MKSLRLIIALVAIVAPALHLLSDVMEWFAGFSPAQLWINYAAFVLMPFMIIGLYAAQRPKIGWLGLTGAVLYGISFIYFTHTTLYAIEGSVADYQTLWNKLGVVYTVHGGLMVAGGLLFGFASLKAKILWRGAVVLFLVGIIINFILGLLPLPDILQTIGSALRNFGLMGMGAGLIISGASDKGGSAVEV
jgi:hypothetical protein